MTFIIWVKSSVSALIATLWCCVLAVLETVLVGRYPICGWITSLKREFQGLVLVYKHGYFLLLMFHLTRPLPLMVISLCYCVTFNFDVMPALESCTNITQMGVLTALFSLILVFYIVLLNFFWYVYAFTPLDPLEHVIFILI
jgi:hypothetical protein